MSIEKEAVGQQGPQTSDPFAYLYPHEFMLLKTFRKNGDAVGTVVWFANGNGKLYITTNITTGKVKRIRNNGRATMTPCDRMGKVIDGGREVSGKARLLPETEQAFQLLARKYGFMYRVFGLMRKLGKVHSTIIEIEPV